MAVTALCLQAAALSFAQAPANDLFASAVVLTGTNLTVTGSNAGATKEPGEPAHAGFTGGQSVWWTWTAPFDGQATVTTSNSAFDTLLGIYTGSAVSQLFTVAASDDEDIGIITSKAGFHARQGWKYHIAVDGYGTSSGAIQLHLQLAPLPSAPAWSLPDADGHTVRSTNYAGQAVLLHFWSTGCGFCRAEIPALIALQNKYAADGLAVIGIALDNTGPAGVKQFIQTNGVNYQVVMGDDSVANAYGVRYLPTTFIIDRQNRILQPFTDPQSYSTFENAILPPLYDNLQVRLQLAPSQLELRWPTNAATFVLECSTNFANPSWSSAPASPEISNGMRTVRLPLPAQNSFYRLRLQN